MNVDQGNLEAFMSKMIGHMTGGTICYGIWLGDELGLYRELAGSGPRTADSVAAKTGCNARLVRGSGSTPRRPAGWSLMNRPRTPTS